MPGPANMTPSDVIAVALDGIVRGHDGQQKGRAKNIIQALTNAGYVIRKQERIVGQGDNEVGRLRAGWPGPGARA